MRDRLVLALAVVALALTLVSAQEGEAPSVQIGVNETWGEHLVDAEGNSLYLYLEDEQGAGVSACVDACTNNWPAFSFDGEPVLGEGVDEELFGTFEREDGETQVTYNGWPLYTFARDTQPGHTRGQGLGNVFFLVSPAGEPVTEEAEQQAAEVDPEVMEQLMTTGRQVYTSNCQVCHGNEGQGAIGPRLAGNANVGDDRFLVERIINGFPDHGMPPFGHLSDEQIAGVSTFVRNSWGNEFGAITPEEVSQYR